VGIKPTYFKIAQTGSRSYSLTDDDKPCGIYATYNLAMIAAHERAILTLPDKHPQIKKYLAMIAELLRQGRK